jgi:CheY-like chemotaxis protein
LALLDRTVDLVLVDHVMPEMNGMEFAKTARAAGHKMPFYLLSSNYGHAQQDPARADVDHIAPRPFRRADLIGWLSELKLEVPSENVETVEPAPVSDVTLPAPDTPDIAPRRMRVLAAEDNKTNRLVFGKMIKSLDIDFKFACDGEEAVAEYSAFDPDLVFMDISMPRMDGKEATRAIRKLEAGTDRHVTIVALTAHAMNGDDQEILKAGLDHYMTKPLRKPEIVARILEHCPKGAINPMDAEPDQEAG